MVSRDPAAIAEEAEQARLSAIVAAAMDAIIAIDDRQRIVLVNPAAEATFGYTRDELIGQDLSLLIPERHRSRHREHVARFAHTGSTDRRMGALAPLTALRKDGGEFPIEATISRAELDGRLLLAVILRDVTQRIEAERTLAREREFVHAILETVDALVLVLDREGRVVRSNAAARAVTGYSDAELFGRYVWDALESCEEHGTDDMRLRELVSERPSPRHQSFWRTKRGERRYIAWSSTVLSGGSGGDDLIIVTGADVTERAIYEEELEAAAQSKDDFLATLGHELRNPLAAVQSALELSRLRPDAERMRNALAVIERQSAHMAKLIDDLLDVSRIVRGKIELEREVTDLRAIVEGVVTDYQRPASAKQVELTCSLPHEPVWVCVDRTRMTQVIANLVNNAVKFTSSGGSVSVTMRRSEGRAEMRVTDTGIGMSREVMRHAFEPFRQGRPARARSGGLGIGLSVVRGLMTLHGGTASAESEGPDQGSAFTVALPLSEHVRDRVTDPPRRHGTLNARRLLLVEDDEDIRRLFGELLEQSGLEVRSAATGEEALGVAAEFMPEAVVSDLDLPGPLSGHDVARTLRSDSRFARTVIVALSGFGREMDRARSAESGFDAHLTKPVGVEDVERIVSELLERRRHNELRA
jgi:PAS domain S-box-containing protein